MASILTSVFTLGVSTSITTSPPLSPMYGYFPVIVAIEDPITGATRVILQINSGTAGTYLVTQDPTDAFANGQIGDRVHILSYPPYVYDHTIVTGGDTINFSVNVHKGDLISIAGYCGLFNTYSLTPSDTQGNVYSLRAQNAVLYCWEAIAKSTGSVTITSTRNPGTATQVVMCQVIAPSDSTSYQTNNAQVGFIDKGGGYAASTSIPGGITGMSSPGGFYSNATKITYALAYRNSGVSPPGNWADDVYPGATVVDKIFVAFDNVGFVMYCDFIGLPTEQAAFSATNLESHLGDFFYGVTVGYAYPIARDTGRIIQRAFKTGYSALFGGYDQEYPVVYFPYQVALGSTIIAATVYEGNGTTPYPVEVFDDYGNSYTSIYQHSLLGTLVFYKSTITNLPPSGKPFFLKTRMISPPPQFNQNAIIVGAWELVTTGSSASFSAYNTASPSGSGPYTHTTASFTAAANSYILGIFGDNISSLPGIWESYSVNSGYQVPLEWTYANASNPSADQQHSAMGLVAEQFTGAGLTTDFSVTALGIGYGGVVVVTLTATPSAACPTPNVLSVGTFYSLTIPVSGGTPPYTFALTAGSLPPGMSLNTSTGVISGTPTTIGEYDWTIRITDSNGAFTDINCSLTAGGNPCVDNTPDENDNAFTLLRVIPTNKGAARTPVRGKS